MADNPWDRVRPIAPGDVLIHIGPPKTGSTSLQATMAARREEMRDLGVLYPGSEARARFSGWAVMGARPRGMRKPRMSEWDELVEEVNASGLRSVVSTEAFGRADAEVIARIVESFGAHRIHVVAVGRRLDKALPSLYQEKVKNFLTMTYEEWLESILPADDLESILASFPPGQQLADTVTRWSAHIDPQRFHLICADEGDRALTPRAFERLLELPEGFLEPVEVKNPSLDRASVELVRRLNEQQRTHAWPDAFYRKILYAGAMRELRYREWTEHDEKVPTPPEWALQRIRTLADHTIGRLHEQGPDLIGDPGALFPGSDVAGPSSPLVEPDQVSMDAALAALVGTFDSSWRQQQEARGQGGTEGKGRTRGRNRKGRGSNRKGRARN